MKALVLGRKMILAAILLGMIIGLIAPSGVQHSASLPPTKTNSIVIESELPTEPCRPEIASSTYPQVSSLRRIDFRNFIYPAVSGCDIDAAAQTVRVRRGEFGDWHDGLKFANVSFGDVSGDGEDEAIVTLGVLTDGNMARDVVYVFTLRHHRPTLIYAFESGDRGQGGLRRAFAQAGRFVVELWGPANTLSEMNNSDSDAGLCCPSTFTRSRYQWRNEKFHLEGPPENLPNPRVTAFCPTCDA